jgi:hypothetical protein
MRFSRVHTHADRLIAGVLVGLFLFGLSELLEVLLARMGIAPIDTLLNNVAIGLLGAVAAYLWVRYESERQARAREKLILAIELNHHIRNALALISECASLQDEQVKYRLIDAAIDRIDRVLTELVPTAGETQQPRFFLDQPDGLGSATSGRGPAGPK